MTLSVITVNFNGAKKTSALLKSLSRQNDSDFLTIVIDNASEETDYAELQKSPVFQGLEIIRNEVNLGFSGGNNVGIKRALENGSDWVLLLNNDTTVEPGFIGSLKAELSKLEGIVGAAIDEDGIVAYCGKVKWLRSRGYHSYDLSEALVEEGRYIIGGCMAIQTNVFEKIGFLDQKYFLYFEDQDYSVRARKAGIQLGILPEIKIHHQPSSTTNKLGSPLLLRYHYRNALYFNRKNAPANIKVVNWLWSFWIIKRQILKIMIGYKKEESRAILNAVFDFYRGKMGKIQ